MTLTSRIKIELRMTRDTIYLRVYGTPADENRDIGTSVRVGQDESVGTN